MKKVLLAAFAVLAMQGAAHAYEVSQSTGPSTGTITGVYVRSAIANKSFSDYLGSVQFTVDSVPGTQYRLLIPGNQNSATDIGYLKPGNHEVRTTIQYDGGAATSCATIITVLNPAGRTLAPIEVAVSLYQTEPNSKDWYCRNERRLPIRR